jgi:hypothetical protein
MNGATLCGGGEGHDVRGRVELDHFQVLYLEAISLSGDQREGIITPDVSTVPSR